LFFIAKLNSTLVKTSGYSLYTGFAHLASGLCCGLSSLAAGLSIGVVGDAGVRANGQVIKTFLCKEACLLIIFPSNLASMFL
jgi:V-type H+-transporting ATPase 16kDa proteolipid subunit